MRGQRWAPFAVAGAALVLVAGLPVARAVLSADPVPAAVRAEPAPSVTPSATPTPEVTPSPTPVAIPTQSPTPSARPSARRTSTSPPPPRVTATDDPLAWSADQAYRYWCRKTTKTTGGTTVTLEYCRWPGPDNDRYNLVTSYTGDRIIYSREVDLGDGST